MDLVPSRWPAVDLRDERGPGAEVVVTEQVDQLPAHRGLITQQVVNLRSIVGGAGALNDNLRAWLRTQRTRSDLLAQDPRSNTLLRQPIEYQLDVLVENGRGRRAGQGV